MILLKENFNVWMQCIYGEKISSIARYFGYKKLGIFNCYKPCSFENHGIVKILGPVWML